MLQTTSASISRAGGDKIECGFILVGGGSGIRSQDADLADSCLGMRLLSHVIADASRLHGGVVGGDDGPSVVPGE
jgi:hypothetical protein